MTIMWFKKSVAPFDCREFTSETEAKEFQDSVYGDYCEKYNCNRKLMKRYEYKYRYTYMEIPVEAYIGNVYSQVNDYLRGKNLNVIDNLKGQYNALIDRLNEIIYLAPIIPENIIVYRGVDDNAIDCILTDVNKMKWYNEKGFMSTSLLYETVLEKFPSYNHILKIYVPKGCHALGVDNITERGEKEILFPEGQRLNYISKYKDKMTKKIIYEFELVNYILE